MSPKSQNPKNNIYLIDGSGFIFRAYYALPPLTRSDGLPVGAVSGFCNMIYKLLTNNLNDAISAPTHDDITAECVASAFDVDLPVNKDAKKLLENYYLTKQIKLNSSRLRMARIPVGAVMIPNPISVAPGFQIKNVFVLAGVPNIFQAMVENIIKNLEFKFSIKSTTITINKAEGDIAEKLSKIASQYPNVSIGSYPFENGLIKGTNIVISHYDEKLIKKIAKFTEKLK